MVNRNEYEVTPSNPCPICGDEIAVRPRGSRHGHPPKTCGERCRKIRASQRERERYQRVKGTEAFKLTRAAYLAKLRDRLAADPEFHAIHRAYAAARVRKSREKLHDNPEKRADFNAAARARYRNWRAQLESDPAAWEAHKAKCRHWYASLSAAEKHRIYTAYRSRQKVFEVMKTAAELERKLRNE